jgi:outer membrane protein TolC
MAKARTTPKEVVTASNHPARRPAQPLTTDSEIARRAYDLYLARGREGGHDVEDWLQAERELNASSRAR